MYHQLQWFVVWTSASYLSSLTVMANSVLEVPEEDTNDSGNLV